MALHLRSRQKVLDFFKKNFLKKIGILFSILALVVSIYALLCTVYSDIIVQNGNDFWGLPMKSLLEKDIELAFEELVGEEVIAKNLHVFVLDISGSIQTNQLGPAAYSKYEDTINAVTETFAEKVLPSRNRSAITIFDIEKARLYDLLLDLYKKNRKVCASEFSIWTVGDEGQKIFPVDYLKADVDYSNIKNAIKKIDSSVSQIVGRGERNTNFVSLFNRFTDIYENELKTKPFIEFENPTFIMTVLSDMIHDVDNQYQSRNRDIDKNWEELTQKIQEICSSRIMCNMIVFSENEPDRQKSLFSLFKKNIDWYRLNKYLINEEKSRDFLFIVRQTANNIKFYYFNPSSISNSKFTLENTGDEKEKIIIDIPLQDSNYNTQKINISCQRLGAKGKPLDNGKRIISGGGEYSSFLEPNERISLTFNGRLPSPLSSPILRISMCNKGRTYLVPIDFVKRLPDWASIFFIVLQMLFWICLLFLFGGFLIFLFFRFFTKANLPLGSEGNGIKGDSSQDQNSTNDGDVTLPTEPGSPGKEEKTQNDEKKETSVPPEPIPETDLVNINTASSGELKKSLGLTAKLAKTIKDKRPIKNLEDLKSRLGKKVFNKIKSQISF